MKKFVAKDNENRSVEATGFEVPDFISTWDGTQSPVLTGIDGKLDPSLIHDEETAKEVSSTIVYGESISSVKMIYIDDDGKAYIASPNDTYLAANVAGMTLQAADEGETGEFIMFGKVVDSSFLFTGVKDLYLDEAGGITDVEPEGMYLVNVGRSLGVNNIFLNIQKPIIL